MAIKTEILIIGGGVIGVCTALFLNRAGREVTLVEKGEICSGASHGNACWVAAGYALPTAAPGVLGQGLKWMLNIHLSMTPHSFAPLNDDMVKNAKNHLKMHL